MIGRALGNFKITSQLGKGGMGEVFQVARDHFFTRPAVAELSAIVLELAESEGEARAANFRDRIGGGRKVAIHILEFFDRLGYSHRVGDGHRIFHDTLLDLATHESK